MFSGINWTVVLGPFQTMHDLTVRLVATLRDNQPPTGFIVERVFGLSPLVDD